MTQQNTPNSSPDNEKMSPSCIGVAAFHLLVPFHAFPASRDLLRRPQKKSTLRGSRATWGLKNSISHPFTLNGA
jgi:hypothetical protein